MLPMILFKHAVVVLCHRFVCCSLTSAVYMCYTCKCENEIHIFWSALDPKIKRWKTAINISQKNYEI